MTKIIAPGFSAAAARIWRRRNTVSGRSISPWIGITQADRV